MRHLLITLFFFSACLFCGGCTNEEEMDGEEGRTGENAVALTVHAVMNGFVGIGSDSGSGSDSPQTRVPAEDGLTTEFKTGDAIGVIVVKNGAIVNGSDNIKLVYTETAGASSSGVSGVSAAAGSSRSSGVSSASGAAAASGSWAIESRGEKLYYYKDATYIAYYPYHANVIATDATAQSVDEIKAYLRSHADLQPKSNQATSADYTAGDLMIAVATSTADDPGGDTTKKVITLDFEHQFSLLTFSINKHLYYVAPSGANYTYHPASGISPDTDAKNVTVNGVTARQTADGEFRVIVTPTPASVTINGEYETANEVAVRYAKTAPTRFTAGNAYQFTVDTQLTGPEFTVTRSVKVGDYYYADGSVWANPASGESGVTPPTEGCIGVVFCTDASRIGAGEKAALQTKGVNTPSGLVLALTNVSDNSCKWGQDAKESGTPFANLTNNVTKMHDDIEGYAKTEDIVGKIKNNTAGYTADMYEVFAFVADYGTGASAKYAAPFSSTGWFLPSTGQWWDVCSKLAGLEEEMDVYLTEHPTDDSMLIPFSTKTVLEMLNIYLAPVPSESFPEYTGIALWLSSEFDAGSSRGCPLVSKSTGYSVAIGFTSKKHTTGVMLARCVLAF